MRIRIFIPFLLLLSSIISIISGSSLDESFSIALMADIHYHNDSIQVDCLKRLVDAVSWINSNRIKENIQLVGVLGDIAWDADIYVQNAKDALDKLEIPYVPIIGNNVICVWKEGEREFNRIFGPQYEYLAKILEGWEKAQLPVLDPETNKQLYLQNFAFNFHGLRIICSDWNARKKKDDPLMIKHHAHMYDFKGGSWEFFQRQIVQEAERKGKKANNILMWAHHPLHISPLYPLIKMNLMAFTPELFKIIANFIYQYREHLGLDFAGHYHYPWHEYVPEGGYGIYILKSLKPLFTWETIAFYKPTIGILRVIPQNEKFTYKYKHVLIPHIQVVTDSVNS